MDQPGRQSDTQGRRGTLYVVLAIGLVTAAGATWVSLRPPTASADTLTVAKFTTTPEFQSLPEEQKHSYLVMLASAKERLNAAYHDGKLTKEEYEGALQNSWLGRTEKHIDQFFTAREGPARNRLIDRIIDFRERSLTRAKTGPNLDHTQFLRKSVESWSPTLRARWNTYRSAIQQRRIERGLPSDPHLEVAG